ncbi:hypothetical protein ONZ45_g1404 [Pleurotus djamor]|nr:hypothetical protein ONZ45_g1404 [Pleurotus djamor]
MSSLSSLIALLAVLLDIRICMQFTSAWAQVAIFPALWTTSWWAASLASPIGRLALWSPTVGTDSYRWLLPWVGTLGIDWVTAAWAVVISQAVGAWFMGSEKPDPIRLIDVESTPNPTPRATLYLTALLAILTIPSFVINSIPLAVIHDDTTPLIVGCVIPPHRRYKHPHLVLKDFIDESKKLATADVIVWPEGAITFQNDQEKETAFAQLASAVSKAHVAVSFEEYYSDVGDSRPSRLRTGLAIISPHNSTPQLTYYKRHLVPIAESYSLTHATRPPSLYTLELPKPSGYNKTDWAPPPSYTRPISLTTSICLDFAIPAPFLGLAHRPGLILAPARTWHPTIAMTMWEQAKQRAAEIGSPILWCDGGDGGVSGIAGQGLSEVTQVGEGSWTREIALHYPLTTRRTLYGLIGELPVILFVWAIVCLGGIGNPLRFKGNIGAGLNWTWDQATTGSCPGYTTSTHKKLLQSRLARGLRGLGSSTAFNARQLFQKALVRREDGHGTGTSLGGDSSEFQQINGDDVSVGGVSSSLDHTTSEGPGPSSGSFFTRLSNISRISLHPSSRRRKVRSAKVEDTDLDGEYVGDLVGEFPSPPTFIPTPTPIPTPAPTPLTSTFAESQLRLTGVVRREQHRSFVSVDSRGSTSSIRRFATVTAGVVRASFHTPISEISLSSRPTQSIRPASAPPHVSSPSSSSTPFFSPRILHLQEPQYERVETTSLTPSPVLTTTNLDISVRTSFVPPSPSWLSRNVGDFGASTTPPLSPLELIFIPSAPAHVPTKPIDLDFPSLPDSFRITLNSLCNDAGVFSSPISDMDFAGKRDDVVDFGGDWDYSDRQWFQDPPPQPPPQAPPSEPVDPYVPTPEVIQTNKDFEIALESAANVLYGKYKQYGQLGVLGWCSEFSELIDALKELGFAGNMFVTTRQCALKACEDILKLKLDIKMQIIVMFLSSQVARLRLFLDGERQWDDYPPTEFPIDPRGGG